MSDQGQQLRTPRAVGRRVDFATVPGELRSWVEDELGGRIVEAVTQVGGMSPGPAARLLVDNGARAFVKAAGTEPNPRTPELFRHEIAVLRRLPSVDYRPDLLASYDDGAWVALLLEDVDGRHPDLDVQAEADAVREVVRAQALALATSASSLGIEGENLADRVRRWHRQISTAQDDALAALPTWWRRDAEVLAARVALLADRLDIGAWCHFDIRDDNLLIRRDGRAVILDWGMSSAGVSWFDELLLDLHVIDLAEFDRVVARRPAYPDTDDLEGDTTDMLLALGGSLAVQAAGPPVPGLPWITDFRRRESHRILVGARRRLGL